MLFQNIKPKSGPITGILVCLQFHAVSTANTSTAYRDCVVLSAVSWLSGGTIPKFLFQPLSIRNGIVSSLRGQGMSPKSCAQNEAFLIAGATQTQLDERVLGTSEKVVSTALLF